MSNLNQFSNSNLKYNVQQVLGGSSPHLDTAEQSAAFQADTVAIAIGSFKDLLQEHQYISILVQTQQQQLQW